MLPFLFDMQRLVRRKFQLALGIVLVTGPMSFFATYLAVLVYSVISEFQTTGMWGASASFDAAGTFVTAVAIAFSAMVLAAVFVYFAAAYALIDELSNYFKLIQERRSARQHTTPPPMATRPLVRIVEGAINLLTGVTTPQEEQPTDSQDPQTPRGDYRHLR